MQEQWKIVGKEGIELIQISFEENRINLRYGPATGFMTRSEEPPEAPIRMMNKVDAEALAMILQHTTNELFRNAKVIRA